MIAENIPDELAVEIPRSLLLNFTNSSDIFKKLNKKNWKRQQVRQTQKKTHFDSK